jgi:RNA polymerase sigma-70 factor, ECF subfamily
MTGRPRLRKPAEFAGDLLEQDLLARARSGDDQAFAVLVRRHEGTVARVAIGMLGPGPDAEEVGQEAMLKLHGALGRFRGDAALATYLTRITINLALRALQRRRTWLQRFLHLDPHDRTCDQPAADRPDGDLDREQLQALVASALRQLAPGERAVVVLRLVEDHSTRETARLLGIAEGTVMSRLSRALHRLRPLLEPHGGAGLLEETDCHER